MQSFLESLPEKIKRSLKKHLSLTELTRFSVMLNSNTAIVGTNKKLLVVTTKWKLFKKNYLINWHDLLAVRHEQQNSNYFLFIKSNNIELNLPVNSDKKPILGELVKKIRYYQDK